MKKSILLLAVVLIASATFATIRTVSNQIPNPGQYTTIQLAINASSAGDTIYVHASPTYYSAFTLDRKLTIIGSGIAPSTSNPNPSVIINPGPITVNNLNASGSQFIALYFYGTNINFTGAGIHDITFNRCLYNVCSTSFSTSMYNVTITENLFFESGISCAGGTAHDFVIANNVFRHNYECCGGRYPFEDWNGVSNTTVTNNLFYSGGNINDANSYITNSASGIIFSNNLFNKVNFTNLSACTFSNCLTFNCNGNTPWINNGTDLGVPALGTQNVANTAPDFINATNINAGGYGGVNWFIVNAGSPTSSSMAGDPDMGPYGGGSYDFRKASASTLPYVYSIVIANPNIQAGTDLNIDVIGEKHD